MSPLILSFLMQKTFSFYRGPHQHSYAMKFFMKIYDARNGLQQVEEEILQECKDVRKITKNHYSVESSSSNKAYNVRKLHDADV